MSTLMQEQLQELIKVGVGGKFRDSNDYLKKVEEELKHEEAMMRGGIERYNHLMQSAQNKGQESTTMYGLYTQQKYIGKLSFLIHAKIKKIETGQVGVHQVAIKKISQCLPKTAFYSDTRKLRDDQSIWDSCSLIVLKNIIDGISNTGSVFIVNFTPESAGDYASGTNHTLPTNGYSKAYSGVNLDSFTKSITFQEITKTGIQNIGPSIELMAEAEGLQAHKNAVFPNPSLAFNSMLSEWFNSKMTISLCPKLQAAINAVRSFSSLIFSPLSSGLQRSRSS